MSRPISGNPSGDAVQFSASLANSLSRGELLDLEVAEGVYVRFVDLDITSPGWIKVLQSGVNVSCVLDGNFRSSFYRHGDADSVPSSLRIFSLREPRTQIVSFDAPSRYTVVQLSLSPESAHAILEQCGVADPGEHLSKLERSCFDKGRFAVVNRNLTVEIGRIARALIQEHRPSPRSRLRLYAHTLELLDGALGQLSREARTALSDTRDTWIEQAARLLSERLVNPPKLEVLASELGVSVDTLQRAFKRRYGLTPGSFLLDLRMDRARELLESTQASVAQIGYSVGYGDPAAFTRVFKRHFGYPPTQHAVLGNLSVA